MRYFALDLRAGVVDRGRGVPRGPQAGMEARGRLRARRRDACTAARRSPTTSRTSSSGALVVGAVNLGTKRIAGFTSEFLVLGALDPDGTVRLLELPPGVAPGAPIA